MDKKKVVGGGEVMHKIQNCPTGRKRSKKIVLLDVNLPFFRQIVLLDVSPTGHNQM